MATGVSVWTPCRHSRAGAWGARAPSGLGSERTVITFWSREEPYIFHFPDGNAGVARALVRALIPDALAGNTMEDLTIGKVDYSSTGPQSIE